MNFLKNRHRPVVVAALQSPHLLNIWRESKQWNLFYDFLGDHFGFSEAQDLQVPLYYGDLKKVRAVLVTSPHQLFTSQLKYPNAKLYWIVHTGSVPNVFPPEHAHAVDGIITLWDSIRHQEIKQKPEINQDNSFVITPYYEVNGIWHWKKEVLFTIRSRPQTRHKSSNDLLYATIDKTNKLLKKNHKRVLFFGQDTEDGYLDNGGKIKIFSSCSGYISALPKKAGFGLAEHEAMSHGVPVIGQIWGDIGQQIPEDYSSLIRKEDSITAMVEQARRMSRDKAYAKKISKLGIKYILEFRNKKNMEEQIKRFTECIL